LRWLPVYVDENSAQRFMATEHFAERTFERWNIQFPFEANSKGNVVGRQLRLKLM
jgi:hypothetical protein